VNIQTGRAKEVFLDALDIDSPDDRRAYLDGACGEDTALRAEVEALLDHHSRVGSFLASGPHDPATTASLDAAGSDSPGTLIGPYKLLERIGEGGFGVVFMAEQSQPVRRKVALKILKAGMDSAQVVARFEAERQALALMDHPNIAKVFDGGATETGRPYFVMELVRGVPITEFCDQNHLSVRERLGLFIPVCQAVQHAHQKGIIHRDLKPTNVLVTLHDGIPVPKVIDFGIAKATGQQLTERTLFTNFAQMVGTPLYMSPEQAEMSGLDVDTRADVYALGVLLYELLTGTTPFDRERFKAAGYDEIRRIIREEEPARPSTRVSTLGQAAATISASRKSDPHGLRRLFRGELDWIVMRCLEKDRNRRYETASALAADVQRYLADDPVQACPPSAWYRFRKLARRNRRALAMISVLTLAVVVGVAALAVSTILVWRANKELTRAVERERLAVDGERREGYFQRITVAHRELSIGNVAAALRALRECPEDLRGWEWHYLLRLCKVEPLVLQDSTEVYGVAFSPDGERIASAGKDGKVKIWNSRTGRIIQEFPAHETAACSVAFHPDGRHLASAGADGLVKVWDLATPRQPVFKGPCDAIRKFGAAHTVAFRLPDGQHLAAGSDEAVRVWDWKTSQLRYTVPGPQYDSIPVASSPDGQRLATGGAWEEGLCLRDAETGRLLGTLPEPRHPVTALTFSRDGGRLASASLGRTVSLWDTTNGELLRTIPHSGNVLGVAFSSDGRLLASTGEDKTVHLWDTATGREVLGLLGHRDMCGCVAFSPDGWRLASASHDRTIIIWDATPLRGTEGQGVFTFDRHDHEVRSVAVSPDGQKIASAGNGTLVRVWEAATGRVSFDFPGHTAPVFAVAWHPDGRRIATAGSAGRQNTVTVWDASDGRVYFTLSIERDSAAGPYQAVAFSPDGRDLVTGQLEGAVKVWDAKTGKGGRVLGAHTREIRGLVFSRDGRLLATASGDGTVKLWDATRLSEKQEPRITLQARVPGPSVNVAFSTDSQRLATGGEENTIKIWDADTGQELQTLRGHRGEVYTLAFSPDDESRWIASGGEDSTVKVWDSRTGKLVHSFPGHTGLISSLAFSLDGKRLYSGSRDKTVKVWDLTQLDQLPNR
jgi:WD40 repeat protein/serine/threonine protein kinase